MGNNASNPVLDPLGEDIQTNLDILVEKNEEREQFIDRIVLDAKAADVKDLSAEISALIKQQKATWKKSAIELVSGEIIRALGGDLAVFNYEPRAKASQEVYLYTGTHWQLLDQQVYFDFINECAQRIGVPVEELHEPAFMERIYWQVAFRVAHSRPMQHSCKVSRINVKNGTLEIRTDGTVILHEHRREAIVAFTRINDKCTKIAQQQYWYTVAGLMRMKKLHGSVFPLPFPLRSADGH